MLTPAIALALALVWVSSPAHAQTCCCDDPGLGGTGTAEIHRTIPPAPDEDGEDRVVKFYNATENLIKTRTIKAGGAGTLSGNISIPLPVGGEKVRIDRVLPAGGSSSPLWMRFSSDVLIWKEGEDETDDARVGRWIPLIGNSDQWWYKRRYAFAPPSGELGKFEHALPTAVLPDYDDYVAQKTEAARIYWKLSLGVGGLVVLEDTLDDGSVDGNAPHEMSRLQLIPNEALGSSTYPISSEKNRLVSRDGNGNILYAADVTATNNYYTIAIFDADDVSTTSPHNTSGTPIVTFQVEQINPDASYTYALAITKFDGANYFKSELHAAVTDDGPITKVIHEVDEALTKTRIETTTSTITSSSRQVDRTVVDNPGSVEVSNVSETFNLVAGFERLVLRVEQAANGGPARKVQNEFQTTSTDDDFGRITSSVNSYNEIPMDWTKYTYAYDATENEYTANAFSPYKDKPTSIPSSPTTASYEGKLTSTTYENATAGEPSRVVNKVEEVNVPTNSPAINKLTVSDVTWQYGMGGPNNFYDQTIEDRRTGNGSEFLRTITLTYPRNPGAANRLWATLPYSIQHPDLTTQRFDYGESEDLAYDFGSPTVIESYYGQDIQGAHTVIESGAGLQLTQNSWKAVEINRDITANTILEFEFKSDSQGEVHGIGFDHDAAFDADNSMRYRTYKVYGNQTWGLADHANYNAGDGWKSYQIQLSGNGAFPLDFYEYMVFVCDDDDGTPNGDSQFRNVRLYESTGSGGTSVVSTTWMEPVAAGKSMRTLTTTDAVGRTTNERLDVWVEGGGNWREGVSQTSYNFDNAGRPNFEWKRVNGKTVASYLYPVEGSVTFSGLDGIESRRKYDRLGRMIEEKQDAVTGVVDEITTTINHSGLTTTTTRSGVGLSLETSQTTDQLGRTISREDENDLVTDIAYAAVSGSGMQITETGPSGIQHITRHYRDGRTKSVETTDGTNSSSDHYNHYIEAFAGETPANSGYAVSKIHRQTAINHRWSRTVTDWAGRTRQVQRQAKSGQITQNHFYHANGVAGEGGHLSHVTTLSNVLGTTVYDYDTQGNRIRTGLENHGGDNTIALDSQEEVTEVETTYVLHGSDVWEQTKTTVYPEDDDETVLRVLNLTGRRLGGNPYIQQSFVVNYTDDAASAGSVTTSKHEILSRGSETSTEYVRQWDLNSFNFANQTGTAIGRLAERNYEGGYLVRENTSTVGTKINYQYDNLGRRTHASNPRNGLNTVTTYWNSIGAGNGAYMGKVKSITDAENNTTEYTYYTDETDIPPGMQKSITDAEGKTVYYKYNILGQTTHVWGSGTYPVKYVYDPAKYWDMTEMHTYRGGSGWNSASFPSTNFGQNSDKTTWNYNSRSGFLIDKTDAQGNKTEYNYHSNTNLINLRTWARAGATISTHYIYDRAGRLLTENHSDNTPDVTYVYDRMGRLERVSDAAGVRDFAEDWSAGHVVTETFQSGSLFANVVNSVTLDSVGRRTSVESTRNSTKLADTTYAYENDTSRLWKVTTGVDGTAHHSQYAYETNSDLVAQIQHHRGGALKLTESRTWDAQVDRLERIMSTKQSGPIVSSHHYLYDRSHRRVRAESEDGAYWKYGYNDRDEVVDASKSLPVSGPVGNDAAIDFNTETPVIYSQHMSGSYTIEDGGATLKLNGNTWRAVAINNFTVTAQTILEFYFKSGEIGEVPGIGFDTDTNHDGTFHQRFFQLSVDPEMPTPQIYGIQDFHTYETDDGWKFYRIPVGAYLNGSTYSHLVFSGDDDTPIPTGSVAKASFKHVRLYDRTDIPGWDYRYSYDNIGNRISVGGDSGDESFDYDYLLPGSTAPSVNQPASIGSGPSYMVKGRTSSTGLLTVNVDGFSPNLDTVVDGDIKYFAGTVLPVKPDQNTITIADSQVNRQYFKFVSPTSYTPGYDEDGNLTEDDRWEYEWDANNRLKKMSTRNAVLPFTTDVTYDFKYDYLGRRIEVKETVGQNAPMVHTFLYDGWNLIARLEGGNLDQSYVWGSDLSGSGQGAGGVGGLLMIYDKGNSRMHLPCYDGNGNVMATVRADTQAVSAEYGYGPFGQTHRLTGNFAEANPFRFSTKYTDTTSGHIYYGLRYYDPRHGRWLSRDPIGERGGLNLYGFVGNNGVNRWDYLGLEPTFPMDLGNVGSLPEGREGPALPPVVPTPFAPIEGLNPDKLGLGIKGIGVGVDEVNNNAWFERHFQGTLDGHQVKIKNRIDTAATLDCCNRDTTYPIKDIEGETYVIGKNWFARILSANTEVNRATTKVDKLEVSWTDQGNGLYMFEWTADMIIVDRLGFDKGDFQYYLWGDGHPLTRAFPSIYPSLYPVRRLIRGRWPISGDGFCCCDDGKGRKPSRNKQ